MSSADAARAGIPIALTADAYPPTGRIVSAGETRIHVHEEGPANGPAVVLIHGASGNSRDFSFDLTGRLAGAYRVLAVDRPGHGHSPALHDRGESPFEQAAALDAAMDRLGVARAVLVGHSYGGAVAMAWALQNPERAAGVVSLGGATMPWPGGLGAWYRIASSGVGGATVVPLISAFAGPGVAERSVDAVFVPQAPPPGYANYVGVGLALRASSLRTNAKQVNALKPHVTAMAQRYSALRLPVEIVHGSEDETVPVRIHGARMVELIPNARLTVLDGVGHMPHHADPEATVAAIDRVAKRAGLR
ncbi:MAG: alpha/beta fold hydrolase [Pseudomonadota bacterium]